jgi:hypothetical protein
LHSFTTSRRERSRGAVVSTRQIEIRPDVNDEMSGLKIHGPSGAGYVPSNWAFGQLATLASAPAGYIRTLPAPIAADALNYGLKFARDVEDVGLLIHRPIGAEGEIAAATGPRYGRIWNAEITRQLVERFGDGVSGDWRVPGEFGQAVDVTNANTTLYASDRDMFCFLADEVNRIEIPNRRDGRKGSLARGFFVWNSEVGSQVFGFAQFLFDYACCNRIVWGAQNYKELRIRHTVSAPDRFAEEIEPTLRMIAHASATPIINTIEAAQAKRIDDLGDFLKTRRFAANMAAKINAAHEREEGKPIETVWDAVTGMTAYAKTISYQDDRVSLEREAGKLLSLVE